MNRLIAIEGISGVGKTSVARALAHALGAVYIKTPIEPLDIIRVEIDESFSSVSRALYYLSGITELSKRVEDVLKTSPVVVDKYVHSSLVYPRINGVNLELPVWAGIRMPNHSFLITLAEEKRIKRLLARGSDLKANKHVGVDKVDRLISAYKDLGLVEISNDGDLDATVATIISKLS